MSYERFLAEIAGPRSICVELYQPLMMSYARVAEMKDFHVNFSELIEELIAFVMEEQIAEAGLEYYTSYVEDVIHELGTTNAIHDADIYIPVVEYLGKVLRYIFRKYDMYVEGVANYRLAHWATPTTLVFEKYMAFDMQPNHPPETGLMVKIISMPEVTIVPPADELNKLVETTLRQYKVNCKHGQNQIPARNLSAPQRHAKQPSGQGRSGHVCDSADYVDRLDWYLW